MMTVSRSPDVIEGWRVAERLARDVGPRVAGSSAERAAQDVIVEEFEALGLRAQVQHFRFIGWNPGNGAELRCTLPDGEVRNIPAHQLGFTEQALEVSGKLTPAGTTQLVEGLIEWPRYAILNGQQPVGYIAVIPGGPSRPFIRPERQSIIPLPTIIVGGDEFQQIAEIIHGGGEVIAGMSADGSYVVGLESSNVVIDLPGDRPDEVIIVNGHYDTMPGTPGAGDNASGVGGCLALAHRFLKRPRRRTLRIGLWGAHEVGLLGSQAYVLSLVEAGHLSEIKAAIALDILSDGDRLGVWSGGRVMNDALQSSLQGFSPDYPIDTFPRLQGETDSWSFAERGIDTAMFLTLPYSRFHLPEDTIENNDPGLFGFSVEVADHLVEYLVNDHLVGDPL
jgi:aminopeptidase YwaD